MKKSLFVFADSLFASNPWRRINVADKKGVNLISIKRTNFLYKLRFGSFYYVYVTREKLPKRRSYEKFVSLMLMKLTPVNFHRKWNEKSTICECDITPSDSPFWTQLIRRERDNKISDLDLHIKMPYSSTPQMHDVNKFPP